MTLEDFFTLTEIKDGLMVTSRVEELVSIMQSNTHSVLNNPADACRQWTTVATTIAATKNRECLDVFVNLDGLLYLGTCLADAQMLPKDSPVEHLILALLQAVQSIRVDSSRLVSSGTWAAVKKLVDHASSRVQDQATKLFGSWIYHKAYEHSEPGNETCSQVHEDQMTANEGTSAQKSTVTLSSSFQNDDEKHLPEIAEEALLSGSSEENNPDHDQALELQNDNYKVESEANTRIETSNAPSTDDIIKEGHETVLVDKTHHILETVGSTDFGTTPTGSSGLLYPMRDCAEGPSNGPLNTEISKENTMGIYENSGRAEVEASSSAGRVIVSSDSVIASIEFEKNSVLQSSLDSNEVSRNASETFSGPHDVSIAGNSNPVPWVTHITGNQDSENSSGLSGNGRHREVENDHMTAHAEKDGKEDDKPNSNRKRRVKTRKKRRSSRSMTVSQCLGAIDRTTADIELGIVDALDVATKVAQEVARDVDSGEPSRSSSVELSDESRQSGSEDSRDYVLQTGSPFKGLVMGENLSSEEPHPGYNDVTDDQNKKPENGIMNNVEVEESRLAVASKFELGGEKSACDFDLNQDTFPDEIEVIMSAISTTATTTTTTVMSVSHSVSTFGMPTEAPLQLGKTLSGNGSAAATSVFHSALPHKVPSGEFGKKQVFFRGIDLNVVAVADEQVENTTPWKQLSSSSSICRSGESSHEANPWGSRRFNLDLNCMNEDHDMPLPSELKMETRLFLSHNAQHSAAPTSLPYSQQSVNEVSFDLNDRPQFLGDLRDQGLYHAQHPWTTSDCGRHQFSEPVISILGTKVDVDRKDSVFHVASSKGKSLEPTRGIYMTRMGNSLGLASGVSFSPSPIYGHSGLMGPPGLSTSAPMFVPGTTIPYKVDSRGTPVMMSQIIGSPPRMQPLFPQQDMLMSVAGGSPSLISSEQPDCQSSGFGVEVGKRESISMRQFLSLEQSVAMGDHSGANIEPSSSSSFSIGRKRKESETRWDFPPWR